MRTHLPTGATRKWSLSLALVAGLAALLLTLTPSIEAQQPPAPHWFWGIDLDAYVGDEIQAVNQAGTVVANTRVGAHGAWSIIVSTQDARTVKLRLITDDVTRETEALDVIEGGFDEGGLSITDFKAVDDDLADVSDDTLTVRIRARVHPTSEDPTIPYRSIEFNLGVNGVPVELNDMPRQRTIRPNHASGRWYRSNWFDLGDGFEAAIIACKDQSGGVRFGVRVEGRDDIIPRLNLLPASRTSTNWARSNEIDLPLPGSDPSPSRAGRGDENCRYGK